MSFFFFLLSCVPILPQHIIIVLAISKWGTSTASAYDHQPVNLHWKLCLLWHSVLFCVEPSEVSKRALITKLVLKEVSFALPAFFRRDLLTDVLLCYRHISVTHFGEGVHNLSALYDANEVRIWKNGVMDFFIFTFLTFQILIETNLFLILCLIKSPPLFKENHFFSP